MPTITIPENVNLGGLIDLLIDEQTKRKAAQEIVDEHDANEKSLEALILAKLEEQGVDKTSYRGYSVGRAESVVPTVKDWDSFYKYIHKTKYYHLLERRPATLGCRELFETKGSIPGVEPFTKVKLSFRKNP